MARRRSSNRRSNALLLLAAACFLACLGSGLAYSGDFDTSSELCAASFTLVESAGVTVFPPGQSDTSNGTTVVFKSPLTLVREDNYGKNKDKVVGNTFGTCTTFAIQVASAYPTKGYDYGKGYKKSSKPQPPAKSFADNYCDITFELGQLGSISIQGPFPDFTGSKFLIAIVGGTGAYEGASGQVAVEVLKFQAVWKYSFYLEQEPDCKDLSYGGKGY